MDPCPLLYVIGTILYHILFIYLPIYCKNTKQKVYLFSDLANYKLKSISYLFKVETTVPISLGSHDRFPSGFLEWKVKTLQVIILQECA